MRDWKSEVRQRLENSGLDGPSEAEMVEELAQHADDRYEELLRAGEDEQTASRIVRAELGHTEEVPRSRVRRRASPRLLAVAIGTVDHLPLCRR